MTSIGRWFYGYWVQWGFAKNNKNIKEAAKAYPSTAMSVLTNSKYLGEDRVSYEDVAEIFEDFAPGKNDKNKESLKGRFEQHAAKNPEFIQGFMRNVVKKDKKLAKRFLDIDVMKPTFLSKLSPSWILNFLKSLISQKETNAVDILMQDINAVDGEQASKVADAYHASIQAPQSQAEIIDNLGTSLGLSTSMGAEATSEKPAAVGAKPKASPEERALFDAIEIGANARMVELYKTNNDTYKNHLEHLGFKTEDVIARLGAGDDYFAAYGLDKSMDADMILKVVQDIDASKLPSQEAYLNYVTNQADDKKEGLLKAYFDKAQQALEAATFKKHAGDKTIYQWAQKNQPNLFTLTQLATYPIAHAKDALQAQDLDALLKVEDKDAATVLAALKGADHALYTDTATFIGDNLQTAKANAAKVVSLLRKEVGLDFVEKAPADIQDTVYPNIEDSEVTADYIKWALAHHNGDKTIGARILSHATTAGDKAAGDYVQKNGLLTSQAEKDAFYAKHPSYVTLTDLLDSYESSQVSNSTVAFDALIASLKASGHDLFQADGSVNQAYFSDADINLIAGRIEVSRGFLKSLNFSVEALPTSVKAGIYEQTLKTYPEEADFIEWVIAQHQNKKDPRYAKRIVEYALGDKAALYYVNYAIQNNLTADSQELDALKKKVAKKVSGKQDASPITETTHARRKKIKKQPQQAPKVSDSSKDTSSNSLSLSGGSDDELVVVARQAEPVTTQAQEDGFVMVASTAASGQKQASLPANQLITWKLIKGISEGDKPVGMFTERSAKKYSRYLSKNPEGLSRDNLLKTLFKNRGLAKDCFRTKSVWDSLYTNEGNPAHSLMALAAVYKARAMGKKGLSAKDKTQYLELMSRHVDEAQGETLPLAILNHMSELLVASKGRLVADKKRDKEAHAKSQKGSFFSWGSKPKQTPYIISAELEAQEEAIHDLQIFSQKLIEHYLANVETLEDDTRRRFNKALHKFEKAQINGKEVHTQDFTTWLIQAGQDINDSAGLSDEAVALMAFYNDTIGEWFVVNSLSIDNPADAAAIAMILEHYTQDKDGRLAKKVLKDGTFGNRAYQSKTGKASVSIAELCQHDGAENVIAGGNKNLARVWTRQLKTGLGVSKKAPAQKVAPKVSQAERQAKADALRLEKELLLQKAELAKLQAELDKANSSPSTSPVNVSSSPTAVQAASAATSIAPPPAPPLAPPVPPSFAGNKGSSKGGLLAGLGKVKLNAPDTSKNKKPAAQSSHASAMALIAGGGIKLKKAEERALGKKPAQSSHESAMAMIASGNIKLNKATTRKASDAPVKLSQADLHLKALRERAAKMKATIAANEEAHKAKMEKAEVHEKPDPTKAGGLAGALAMAVLNNRKFFKLVEDDDELSNSSDDDYNAEDWNTI